MRTLLHLCVTLCVLVGSSACKSQAIRPELVSPEAVMLPLPLVHQDELYECGLVSITALCQYYDTPIPQAQCSELSAIANERHGLSGAELQTALEALGMETLIFEGSLDQSVTGLYRQIDNGRPPIVMLSPDGKTHHYCLFLGYDLPLGNVFLLDPVRGQVCMPHAGFERSWERSKHFTLLSFPAPKTMTTDDPNQHPGDQQS